jgi:sulfur relay (sulfurtransferase) DsrF/TusC family protein
VASTSGDLRLAIKACRGALDALAAARAQHFAAAAAAAEDGCSQAAGKAPPACVGVRDMMASLGRLAGGLAAGSHV